MVPVALELEHAVDQVLEDTWTGDRSVLRHVTNQEQRDAGLLADAKEPRGGLHACETDPGADPTSGEYRVWTESMTQTAGRSRSSVAQIASRSVSARISTRSAPPRRVARSLTCAFDSSPVTSSARRLRRSPRAPSAGASTSPRPAPRRRVRGRRTAHRRGHGRARGRPSGSAPPPPPPRRPAAAPGAERAPSLKAAGGASTTSVPKLPQPGQRPSQRPVDWPHSEQAYLRAGWATERQL